MKSWLMAGAMSVLALLAPAKELFIAATLLVLADMLTGVWAAHKTGRKITSAGFRRTFTKLLLYNIGIGAGFLVQRYMMKDTIPVSNIISSVLGLTELKSIIENTDRIKGGSVMKAIIARLGSVNDTLHKSIDKKDDSK